MLYISFVMVDFSGKVVVNCVVLIVEIQYTIVAAAVVEVVIVSSSGMMKCTIQKKTLDAALLSFSCDFVVL